jgi:hypothetical protein
VQSLALLPSLVPFLEIWCSSANLATQYQLTFNLLNTPPPVCQLQCRRDNTVLTRVMGQGHVMGQPKESHPHPHPLSLPSFRFTHSIILDINIMYKD